MTLASPERQHLGRTEPLRPALPAGAFTEPGPVAAVDGALDTGVLLLCDHASNRLPPRYGRLGLDPSEFERHIAYDIGAETVTRTMAAVLGCPALMTTFSRLLIDPNRGARDPTLVMKISDGAIVPGNAAVDAAEVQARRAAYWQPYHDRIDATLDAMLGAGRVPAVVSIHSFTPSLKGIARPWHVGLLWDDDPRIPLPLAHELARDPALAPALQRIGDNEPYDGALPGDTIDTHATRRGLANVLIEVRQDLIGDESTASDWGVRLARCLAPVLRRPDIGTIRHHPSRAGRKARRLAALEYAP
jgi:predicted N-formylglutamate amidohydrolase